MIFNNLNYDLNNRLRILKDKIFFQFPFLSRIAIFFTVFGPATITAMADNDASGVVTYSIAGARLGYPILFVLVLATILLAITQEMGIRLSIVSRQGLADLIRENFGVRVSVFIFLALFAANTATTIVDLSAIKTASRLLSLPAMPMMFAIIVLSFILVVRGSYKSTQNIMLLVSFFYICYIISAVRAKPDWGLALSNLFIPHSIELSRQYLSKYLIIGLGVLGTTITPWGQFFISAFALDKKIETQKATYARFETYCGSFLVAFFSFFIIVATAATLYINNIPLASGEEAALAIRPFVGDFAGTLFAFGILNAGFFGIIIVSLTTAYAFSEFFGLSGSLDRSFTQSRVFYSIFLIQLIIAFSVNLFPQVSLFKLAVAAQALNAMMLPLVFKYLIHFTSSKKIMGEHINTCFKRKFAKGATIVIIVASILVLITSVLGG